jgi:hypothetical protein
VQPTARTAASRAAARRAVAGRVGCSIAMRETTRPRPTRFDGSAPAAGLRLRGSLARDASGNRVGFGMHR